jgi:hypothetical protein
VCFECQEKLNDAASCSPDDYTIRVDGLPHLPPDRMADLDKFRHSLQFYFEKVCADHPFVIRDRPCKVIDINFGLNDQASDAW